MNLESYGSVCFANVTENHAECRSVVEHEMARVKDVLESGLY